MMRRTLEMTENTFRLLQEFIYENTGIRLGPDQIASIERRLTPVCEALALDSLDDLYTHARYHPRGRQTLEAMIEALTTHETYFNREHSQFELVTREILAQGQLNSGRGNGGCPFTDGLLGKAKTFWNLFPQKRTQ